jgi:hypothetical protein
VRAWCYRCRTWKARELFHLDLRSSTGVQGMCKACRCRHDKERRSSAVARAITTEQARQRRKTPRGYLCSQYTAMRARTMGYAEAFYKGLPILPRLKFYTWALTETPFMELFAAYRASGWEYRLSPSVDRIDSTKGYTLDNIRFLTLSENCKRERVSHA